MQVIWLRDKTSVLATTILGGAWGGPILDQKETLTFTDRIWITECQNFMNALTSLWICVKKPQFCQEYLEITWWPYRLKSTHVFADRPSGHPNTLPSYPSKFWDDLIVDWPPSSSRKWNHIKNNASQKKFVDHSPEAQFSIYTCLKSWCLQN